MWTSPDCFNQPPCKNPSFIPIFSKCSANANAKALIYSSNLSETARGLSPLGAAISNEFSTHAVPAFFFSTLVSSCSFSASPLFCSSLRLPLAAAATTAAADGRDCLVLLIWQVSLPSCYLRVNGCVCVCVCARIARACQKAAAASHTQSTHMVSYEPVHTGVIVPYGPFCGGFFLVFFFFCLTRPDFIRSFRWRKTSKVKMKSLPTLAPYCPGILPLRLLPGLQKAPV